MAFLASRAAFYYYTGYPPSIRTALVKALPSTDRAGEKSAEILREENGLVFVGIERNDALVKSQKIKSYKRSAPSDGSLKSGQLNISHVRKNVSRRQGVLQPYS